MPDRFFRAGIAAASLCCLVLASACSSTNDDDDTTPDAGQQQQTDAGQQQQTDAGDEQCPLTTDCSIPACDARACGNGGMCSGGTCVEPTQIGESCSGATQAKPEGTCSTGQLCSDFEFAFFSRQEAEGKSTCTKSCVTDADCGQTDGVDNSCIRIDASNSLCVKGCTPGGSDCQDDLVCLTFGDTQDAPSVCVQQCAENADCIFGMTCTPAGTGIKACNPQRCPQEGCGDGRACQPFGQQSFCVDSCSDENPCPNGLECETATGICKAHAGDYYQICNASTPCTEADAICVNQGGDGVCLQNCEGGMCGEGTPAGTFCGDIQTTSGIPLCSLPCTQGTTCPNGTTCQSLGGPRSHCLPTPPPAP